MKLILCDLEGDMQILISKDKITPDKPIFAVDCGNNKTYHIFYSEEVFKNAKK